MNDCHFGKLFKKYTKEGGGWRCVHGGDSGKEAQTIRELV
jgi:hypothetical protein